MAKFDFSHVSDKSIEKSYEKSTVKKEEISRIQNRVNEISFEIKRQCNELNDEEFILQERVREREALHKETLKLIQQLMRDA